MSGCHDCDHRTVRRHGGLAVALAGNPNTGKSSIFNALTGSRQLVGNWPGQTVERRLGSFQHADLEVTVVDLPGAYSLAAESPDEIIARDHLTGGDVDAVVVVVDAANLERNLYLTVQVLEIGLPTVIALNMIDVAHRRGVRIDAARLAARLGAPVVPTVARIETGITELSGAIVHLAALETAK